MTQDSASPRSPASAQRPAPTVDAATVLLARDAAAGLEVFMLVRHRALDFASGAMVFPGGAVDPQDRTPALRGFIPPAMREMSAEELAFRAAAIREAYEECGVLLAREPGADTPIAGPRLAAVDARYAEDRRAHRVDLGRVAREAGLELAVDALVPFAHWITPVELPKRFDTRFYLAASPGDQIAFHDGTESVHSVWMRPEQVCAEAEAGRWNVMFPTRLNLERLAESATVADAIAAARGTPVVPVLPRARRVEGARHLSIPAAAGYGVSEVRVDRDGRMHRVK